MRTSYDIEKITGQFSEKDLLKGISGKLTSLSRGEAIRLYLQKNPRDKLKVLETIINDKEQIYKVRLIAINELGKSVSKEDQEILLKNLNTKDDRILSRVAKVLGRSGDKIALASLQKLRINTTSLSYNSVNFAKQLIAYRIRTKEETIKPLSSRQLLKIDPRKNVKLETQMANSRKIGAAIEKAQKELHGLSLTNQGVVQIFCRNTEFLMVFNKDFQTSEDFVSLKKSKGIPIVLLKKRECPDEYVLSHYFFSQPSENTDEVILTGVRPGGTPTYSGRVKVSEDKFHFSLRTAKNPYVSALQMEADYDYKSKVFTIDEAVSDIVIDREQNPKKTPQKAKFMD